MSESEVRERYARELLSLSLRSHTGATVPRVSSLKPYLDILARYRDEALEEAAVEADSCYHGPRDHGCAHGQGIARAIRALKATR